MIWKKHTAGGGEESNSGSLNFESLQPRVVRILLFI
jgi:hypothetical protein